MKDFDPKYVLPRKMEPKLDCDIDSRSSSQINRWRNFLAHNVRNEGMNECRKRKKSWEKALLLTGLIKQTVVHVLFGFWGVQRITGSGFSCPGTHPRSVSLFLILELHLQSSHSPTVCQIIWFWICLVCKKSDSVFGHYSGAFLKYIGSSQPALIATTQSALMNF